MTICPQCKVKLLRGEDTCPFCHCVTEVASPEEEEAVKERYGNGAPYPNAQRRSRLLRFWLRLTLFILILLEAGMVTINVIFTPTLYWSVVTGVALLYVYVIVVYWIRHDSGLAPKMGLQLVTVMVMLYALDRTTGNYGWALRWAVPTVILLGDGAVFLLMMLHRSRWFSYMLLLLCLGACSVAIIIFYFAGLIAVATLPAISAAVTGIYILAVFLLGDRTVKRELGRRFHV